MIVKLREATPDERTRWLERFRYSHARLRRTYYRLKKNGTIYVLEYILADGTAAPGRGEDRPAEPTGGWRYSTDLRLREYEKERALGVLLGTSPEREGRWATVIGRGSRAHFFTNVLRDTGPGMVERRAESICGRWVLGKYGTPIARLRNDSDDPFGLRAVYDVGERRLTCTICGSLVLRYAQ